VHQSPVRLWLNCLVTETCLQPGHLAAAAVHPSWQDLLEAFWASETGSALSGFLDARLAADARVFPPEPLRALRLTALSDVQVVILGQDPYHGLGQAEGLAFSVQTGVKLPPSLRNLFKERLNDLGLQPPMSGSLLPWAAQGVLLLNTTLTVEEGRAGSHAKRGWEKLTDSLIQAVAERRQPCVFLLWGAHAQAKSAMIRHAAGGPCLVLEANHPSPLSALRGPVPFMGCGHFSATQAWLADHGLSVNWALEA
jgi:uracil-DNA glycosylase